MLCMLRQGSEVVLCALAVTARCRQAWEGPTQNFCTPDGHSNGSLTLIRRVSAEESMAGLSRLHELEFENACTLFSGVVVLVRHPTVSLPH